MGGSLGPHAGAHRPGDRRGRPLLAALAADRRTLDAAAVALKKRRENIIEAARWAHENKRGSKAVCKAEDSPFKDAGLTHNMVEPHLRELRAGRGIDYVRDHHNQILTNDERRKLAEWMLQCADGQDPKDRAKISAKVKEMLRARHASNKKKKYGAGSIRLTASTGARVVSCRARGPSGSAAPPVGPRAACARPGRVWPPASLCCSVTTQLWRVRRSQRVRNRPGLFYGHGTCLGGGPHVLL